MKIGIIDSISIVFIVVDFVVLFIPEVMNFVLSLDIIIRIFVIPAIIGLPVLLQIYARFLKPKHLTDRYPFDPVRYYSEEVNRFISGDLACIELYSSKKGLTEKNLANRIADNSEFSLPPDFSDRAKAIWEDTISEKYKKEGKKTGTHSTARLFDFEKKASGLVLFFQRAEYWQAVTNFHLDWKGWGEHIRDKITPEHAIKPLKDSVYSANHLGMGCILVTKDGKIVIQKRSKEVALYPEQLGLSTDGALAWEDRPNRISAPSPFMGIHREMNEELGVNRDDISDIRLIALYRKLEWGGKPAVVFVAHSNKTWRDILEKFRAAPKTRWETDRLIPLNNNRQEIKQFMARADICFPTKVGLYYYLKTLD